MTHKLFMGVSNEAQISLSCLLDQLTMRILNHIVDPQRFLPGGYISGS